MSFAFMLMSTEHDLQLHMQEDVCQWDTCTTLPSVWKTLAGRGYRELTQLSVSDVYQLLTLVLLHLRGDQDNICL